MELEVRPLDLKIDELDGSDITFSKDRISSLTWATRLTILAILISIAHIVLNSLILNQNSLSIVQSLLAAAVIFLIMTVLIFYWARKATKAYNSSHEMFQPRISENLTKFVFLASLILAGITVFLWVNLFVQRPFPGDYVTAQASSNDSWTKSFGDCTVDAINSFFYISFITQLITHGFFFFYFLFVARTAFRCLKRDNQAISSLVFVGCVLLLALGLSLVYFSHHALSYSDYPQIKAHFPIWNIRSLFLVGIVVSALSLVGFLVDHRSWRIGFLVFGFLVVFGLIVLANFTAFAYRHTNSTYNYYKGTESISICINRMYVVDANELQSYGCPAKYIISDQCETANRVTVWEKYNPHPQGTPLKAKPSDSLSLLTGEFLDAGTYCLNTNCCGILGQVYTHDLLTVANFALLTILAGILVIIGSVYFWSVNWIDSARQKGRDYIYLAVMFIIIIAFAYAQANVDIPLVAENV